MRNITTIFPPPAELITLLAEDVAAMLLEFLNDRGSSDFNKYNLLLPGATSACMPVPEHNTNPLSVLWKKHGHCCKRMVAGTHSGPVVWHDVFRYAPWEGNQEHHSYRLGNLLPGQSLDPVLPEKVRPLFLSGDEDGHRVTGAWLV